jgi:hypothetical protein
MLSALAAVLPKTVMTTTGMIHKNFRIGFPHAKSQHTTGPNPYFEDLSSTFSTNITLVKRNNPRTAAAQLFAAEEASSPWRNSAGYPRSAPCRFPASRV